MGTAAIHVAAHRVSIVPESSLAKDWCCICGPALTVTSKVMLQLCLMSLFPGGSLRACPLQVVSLTTTLCPFQDRSRALMLGGCGAGLISSVPQAHHFGLLRVELGLHGGGSPAGSLSPAENSSPIVTCKLAKSSNLDCFSIWASGEWKAVQC